MPLPFRTQCRVFVSLGGRLINPRRQKIDDYSGVSWPRTEQSRWLRYCAEDAAAMKWVMLGMYRTSCRESTWENVKMIKESSQENSNNFYCTFLLGLGKTSQLFLLLRPPTNTQSQGLDEASQSDWWQVRCAHSFYSWDLKRKEIKLILDLWQGELEVQIVAALSQIQSRNREGTAMTS